jgi:hypothetical protein
MKRLIPCCIALLLTLGARAQSYSIDWYKIAGGGGTSTNGQYSLSGTIGQHDAGVAMAGGNFSIQGGFWALYAVQTPGAPKLFISALGGKAVLFWQAASSGYQLEANPDVASSGGWSTVAQTVTTLNGTNYVTNPISAGNSFFRLRKPN